MGTSKWRVRDKTRCLLAVMEELAGNAHISFEGDLRGYGVLEFPGASDSEMPPLRRSTIWPRQDFVVVPLERKTESAILSAIGGQVPKRIIHIQIEKHGILEFGAYDNFRPESLFGGAALSNSFLGFLAVQGIRGAISQSG